MLYIIVDVDAKYGLYSPTFLFLGFFQATIHSGLQDSSARQQMLGIVTDHFYLYLNILNMYSM